jgi:arginase family enzyme
MMLAAVLTFFSLGKNSPVYLSIDIDTIDPAFAPATGTPETGGWSTREIRTIIRGLEGINLAAADIVEVAPAYDTNAELTTMVSRYYCGCSSRSYANRPSSTRPPQMSFTR